MRLNVWASSPISLPERTPTRDEKSPSANDRDAAASCLIGRASVSPNTTAAATANPRASRAHVNTLSTIPRTGEYTSSRWAWTNTPHPWGVTSYDPMYSRSSPSSVPWNGSVSRARPSAARNRETSGVRLTSLPGSRCAASVLARTRPLRSRTNSACPVRWRSTIVSHTAERSTSADRTPTNRPPETTGAEMTMPAVTGFVARTVGSDRIVLSGRVAASRASVRTESSRAARNSRLRPSGSSPVSIVRGAVARNCVNRRYSMRSPTTSPSTRCTCSLASSSAPRTERPTDWETRNSCERNPSTWISISRAREAAIRSWYSCWAVARASRLMSISFQPTVPSGASPVNARTATRVNTIRPRGLKAGRSRSLGRSGRGSDMTLREATLVEYRAAAWHVANRAGSATWQRRPARLWRPVAWWVCTT